MYDRSRPPVQGVDHHVTRGEKHEADIVARVAFQGEDAFFLIHVENQAKAQAEFGQRMFRYWARLYEKHGIPVYPVVIFSFDTPSRKQEDRFAISFPGFTPLQFHYRAIQLNRLRWRAFVDQPNPIASALMAKMQIAERDRPRVKFECLRLLATLKLDRARMQLISGFVDSYLRLTPSETRQFQAQLAATGLQEQEVVMQIVTSGMEEGMAKGRQEGRQEGMESIVERMIRHRFRALPQEMLERIRHLNEEQLGDLGEALFDLDTLEALNAWLERSDND